MKKLYYVLFFLITGSQLIAQVPSIHEDRDETDVSVTERQVHQRFRNATLNNSMDSFTVASENIDVTHYRCEWQVDPNIRYINGKVTISFIVKNSLDKIIFDLSNHLDVDSIIYHGSGIGFQRVLKDGLQLQLPATINTGQKDSVSIFYKGIPDPLFTGVFHQGIYRGDPDIWTLSEPYGSKLWWPCKNGITDKADSIDIIVTRPDAYLASTNGVIVKETSANGQTTTHFKHGYPIASYLVAIAVGEYYVDKDSVQLGGRQMPVIMYVLAVATPNRHKPAITVAKQCLQKFSELFGIYPFHKEHYCQTQWLLGGGMEHQTNSFLGNSGESLVSHELGHQWFGNKVTCGSWQDLWLNEGFATYTTNIFYEHFNKPMLKPTLQAVINSITSLPDGSVWVDDTANVGRLFSGRLTYYKGSYVVHMLRGVLGDSVFFRGVRRFLDDAAVTYSFARTSDLRRALEAESGKNLKSFFDKWVYGQGYPDYHAEWSQNNNNWIKVKLNQTTSHSSVRFYEMPVTLVAKNGSTESKFVVDHRYSGQEFWLNPGFIPDTIMIDPDLWILSKKKTSAKVNGNTTAANELMITPNPAPDLLRISLRNPTDKKLNIQLLNTLGQVIFQKDVQTPGSDELIDISMSTYPKGIYWLKLNSDKGTVKLLKKIVH